MVTIRIFCIVTVIVIIKMSIAAATAVNSPIRAIFSSSTFGGLLAERNNIAIILIFIEQFIVVFAPIILNILSFIHFLIYSNTEENLESNENDFLDVNNSDLSSEHIEKGKRLPTFTFTSCCVSKNVFCVYVPI